MFPTNNLPALVQMIILVANRRQASVYTDDGLHYWYIYAFTPA